ncbi:phage integrase N-terminal domain-containing protein [Vibrio vulnificus]|jgi:integrase|uniref:phage integrase N-terminal domain-containing protein n=1 Tax=Vibrio vulnificus TaxID=672 RepID=UPI0002EB0534|nr:phage integrase N-terminal domain-containing protein [Vibrio vulnificus]EGQ7934848.1 integrase [Vibrio vulnificus]EIE1226180.1 integrase domain-containing protein [Vibrio vulnificus]EJS4042425.1 integrase domain-containing protein [Vibrio vulnificus]ELP8107135.1 integrase domain-containing protein [Vibrio vulnificus]MCA3897346.1 integrase domain-containing protein [Vibrio vulnificus]
MATNFMFKVTQVLKRNPNGSHATQAERRKVLKLLDQNLRELGFCKLELHNLGPKHLNAVIGMWMSNGLATGTIKNRVAHLRWLLEKIGKSGVLPANNTSLGIPKRVYVTNQDKSRELKEEQLNRIDDPYLCASFRLQAAFGLRREESMKIRLSEADKGDFLRVTKTKGARPRNIPITTSYQRELLDQLKPLVGVGSLIPPDLLYKTQLGRYEQACVKMGIDRAHGLRHAYAQKRYLELVGLPCPAKGGPKASALPNELREQIKRVRFQISEELGHGREEVTAVYLGR